MLKYTKDLHWTPKCIKIEKLGVSGCFRNQNKSFESEQYYFRVSAGWINVLCFIYFEILILSSISHLSGYKTKISHDPDDFNLFWYGFMAPSLHLMKVAELVW